MGLDDINIITDFISIWNWWILSMMFFIGGIVCLSVEKPYVALVLLIVATGASSWAMIKKRKFYNELDNTNR